MVTRGSDGGQPPVRGRVLRGVALAAVAIAMFAGGTAPQHGSQASAAAVTTAKVATVSPASYELLGKTAPKRPLRWLACRPIDFRINTAAMPKGMDAVVKSVMREIGKQTGATFHYAGTTKRTFSSTSRPATPTIYIGFTAKTRAYGYTFGYPGEVGVGGPTGAWYVDGDGRRYEAITSGRVLLSTTFHGPRTGAGATWQSLITHEVGHALNLAHRSAAHAVMNPTLSAAAPGRFSPAEVTALRGVLQRTGCDYDAWSRL